MDEIDYSDQADSFSCLAELTDHLDAGQKSSLAKIARSNQCAIIRSPVVGYSIAGPPIAPPQPQTTRTYRAYRSSHSVNSN